MLWTRWGPWGQGTEVGERQQGGGGCREARLSGWGGGREGGAELGRDPRKAQCLGPGKLSRRPVWVEVPSLGHGRTGQPGLQPPCAPAQGARPPSEPPRPRSRSRNLPEPRSWCGPAWPRRPPSVHAQADCGSSDPHTSVSRCQEGALGRVLLCLFLLFVQREHQCRECGEAPSSAPGREEGRRRGTPAQSGLTPGATEAQSRRELGTGADRDMGGTR